MNAADLMTTRLLTLPPDCLVGEAVARFAEARFQAFPIVDGRDKLCGLLSIHALIEQMLPRYIVDGALGDLRFAPDLGQMHERMQELRRRPVSSVMTRDPPTVDPDTSALACAALLHKEHSRCPILPVVDKAGVLVGVIAPWDLVKEVDSKST